MRDEGLLKFYDLVNTADAAEFPEEKLVDLQIEAFYANKTIGYGRMYAAKGANYKLDRLVHVYMTSLPENAKYCILEDGRQYRIGDVQAIVDEDALDLSLERLNDNYEVLD